MRIGPRRPNLRGRIAARTSLKRAVRRQLGLKAPRGYGWMTNPRRAAYNRIYRRTTFGLLPRGRGRHGAAGVVVLGVLVLALLRTCSG